MVIAGLPQIEGSSLVEKRQYVIDHMQDIIGMLIDEPRGHIGMRGAILTTPTCKEAHLGVIFIGGGCMPSCGHSTIGVVTTALEIGMLPATEPVTEVMLETPAGLVQTKAAVKDGRVASVSMINTPAFLYEEGIRIDVPGAGMIEADIAFGGNFNAIVRSMDLGVEIKRENITIFIDRARSIRGILNQKVRVVHPEKPFITGVTHVQFYGPAEHPEAQIKNITISPPGMVDRSPCGTGTCARLAHLFSKGDLNVGEVFVHESIIGTLFKGRVLEQTNVGDYVAVVPEISGSAHITGFHQFVCVPRDPCRYGFKLV
jgi:proline racemase